MSFNLTDSLSVLMQDNIYTDEKMTVGGRECSCNASCDERQKNCCEVECDRKCKGSAVVLFGEKYRFKIHCKRGDCKIKVLYMRVYQREFIGP